MERIIEVSHWGNIAVEEHIEVRHSGAILKGPFSRYDYQRTQDQGASVKSFKVLQIFSSWINDIVAYFYIWEGPAWPGGKVFDS